MKYMTVKDVLDYVNEVKDNTFSRRTKLIWLNELEYRVQTDVMLLAAESVQSVPDEDDHELLVPAPWHEIYYDYLFMKLSEHLEESSEQNNRAATFEKAFGRFMKWWADTYNPRSGKAGFKGYYLVGPPGRDGIDGRDGSVVLETNLNYSQSDTDVPYNGTLTWDALTAAVTARREITVYCSEAFDGGARVVVYLMKPIEAYIVNGEFERIVLIAQYGNFAEESLTYREILCTPDGMRYHALEV